MIFDSFLLQGVEEFLPELKKKKNPKTKKRKKNCRKMLPTQSSKLCELVGSAASPPHAFNVGNALQC